MAEEFSSPTKTFQSSKKSKKRLSSPLLEKSILSVGGVLASVSPRRDDDPRLDVSSLDEHELPSSSQRKQVSSPREFVRTHQHTIYVVFLFFATTLSWGTSVFLFSVEKRIDKTDPLSIGAIQLHVGMGTFVCVFLAFCIYLKDMMKLKYLGFQKAHLVGVLAGICNNLGNQGYALMVLSGGGSTVLGPFSGMYLVVTVTLGIVFLKEPLTVRKVVGATIVVGAIFLLSYNFGGSQSQGEGLDIWGRPKVIGYFFLSFFGWGFGRFFMAVMGPSSTERRGTVLCISGLSFVCTALIVTFSIHGDISWTTTSGHGVILISGFLGALGNMFFTVFVGSDGQASIISPLTSLNVIWPILFGATFLNETVRDAQIGGILLAVFGIFVLCARDWEGMVQLLCPSKAKYLVFKKRPRTPSYAEQDLVLGNIPSMNEGLTHSISDENIGKEDLDETTLNNDLALQNQSVALRESAVKEDLPDGTRHVPIGPFLTEIDADCSSSSLRPVLGLSDEPLKDEYV